VAVVVDGGADPPDGPGVPGPVAATGPAGDDDEHAHIDPRELRDANDAPTNGVDLLMREFGGGELVEEEQ
jgi:hypothetical protein